MANGGNPSDKRDQTVKQTKETGKTEAKGGKATK